MDEIKYIIFYILIFFIYLVLLIFLNNFNFDLLLANSVIWMLPTATTNRR